MQEAVKLRRNEKSALNAISAEVDEGFFADQTFNIGTVHTKVFVLLLAQGSPLSYVSGAPIKLGKVLQAYNRNEFHHLYPQKYLRDTGWNSSEIGVLVNFVFMSSADNKTLGGVAPSVYRDRMDGNLVPKILESSYCPASLFDDEYSEFVYNRASILVDVANKLMNQP